MTQAFICDAIRTPVGRYNGGLSAMRVDDLAAHPIKALMQRNANVDWGSVDDVIYGCTETIGSQAGDIARTCWLAVPVVPLGPSPSRSRSRSTWTKCDRRQDSGAALAGCV